MSQGFLPFVFGCVCIFIIGLEVCVHEKYVYPIVLMFTKFSILWIFTFTVYVLQFCNTHAHAVRLAECYVFPVLTLFITCVI